MVTDIGNLSGAKWCPLKSNEFVVAAAARPAGTSVSG
jgi:hypothetical protein